MAQRSDPRDSNGFGIIYLSDAARLALQSRTMEENVGREQEGGIVVCGELGIRPSPCLSAARLAVWLKQKEEKQTKANSIQRVHLHALLFSLLPFFPLSAVTNLALSSLKLQV